MTPWPWDSASHVLTCQYMTLALAVVVVAGIIWVVWSAITRGPE